MFNKKTDFIIGFFVPENDVLNAHTVIYLHFTFVSQAAQYDISMKSYHGENLCLVQLN
jgi:hypothetical protein